MLLFHKVSKSKMAANPALWFLPWNCYPCIIKYFETVRTDLSSQNQTVSNSCVGLWLMAINYVNNEMLWLENTLQSYCKIVGCGRWWNVPNRNFYNSTMRHLLQQFVHNKRNKKLLQHAMRPNIMHRCNQENKSFTLNKAFFPPPCPFPIWY